MIKGEKKEGKTIQLPDKVCAFDVTGSIFFCLPFPLHILWCCAPFIE